MHFVTIELVRKINGKVGGNHHFIFTSVLNNCEVFDSDQLKKYCKRLTKFTQSYLKQSLKTTHGKLWHFMAVLSCFPMHGLSDLTPIATLTVQPSLGTRKWLYYLYLVSSLGDLINKSVLRWQQARDHDAGMNEWLKSSFSYQDNCNLVHKCKSRTMRLCSNVEEGM